MWYLADPASPYDSVALPKMASSMTKMSLLIIIINYLKINGLFSIIMGFWGFGVLGFRV
jgi:hypothetical protein